MIGDIYQCEIFYNIGSEVTMNVVHFVEVVTCTDEIPAETVAKLVYDLWKPHIESALFSDETNLTLIRVRRIKPTAGVPATAIIGSAAFPAVNGGGVGDPLPSTSAALISLYTDTHNRNSRGRIYLPGIASGTQNDGQFLAVSLALLAAMGEDFEDDVVPVGGGTGEFHMVVYSRNLGTGKEVTQTIAHSNLATQRGRRNHPGLGV